MSNNPASLSQLGNYPTKLNVRETKVVATAASETTTAITTATATAVAGRLNVAKATIGFAALTDGVAVAFGPTLPAGAIVAKCYGRVLTLFDGDGDGSSTVSLGLNTNIDVQAATAVAGAPYSSTGMKAFKDGAAGNMIILTEARQLKALLTIAATDNDLISGEVDVYIEYVTAAE